MTSTDTTVCEDNELEPLKAAVLSALQSDGSLDDIRAQLRARVFNVCSTNPMANSTAGGHKQSALTRPQPSDETLFANQLIVEYLRLNGYKHSLSVFEAESGHQRQPTKFDRRVAQHKLALNVTKDDGNNEDKPLPVLTQILRQCLKKH